MKMTQHFIYSKA